VCAALSKAPAVDITAAAATHADVLQRTLTCRIAFQWLRMKGTTPERNRLLSLGLVPRTVSGTDRVALPPGCNELRVLVDPKPDSDDS